MIKDFIEKNRICFHQGFDTWEQSVAAACQPLIEDGSISDEYIESIISSINKFGPYVVIAPNICIPHAQAGGPGVYKSSISMMVTQEAVAFEPGNSERDARLFFVLAANDPQEHLNNLVKLVDMLSDDLLVEKLLNVKNLEDLKQFI